MKWGDASPPDKRGHRLRDYSALKSLAQQNPESRDIYEANMLDTYYPHRPTQLDQVSLYDFIANYEFAGLIKDGQSEYRKLNKPHLPNHRLYDPTKDSEVNEYNYSLLLLFDPFRHENNLLQLSEPPSAVVVLIMLNYRKCSTHKGGKDQ